MDDEDCFQLSCIRLSWKKKQMLVDIFNNRHLRCPYISHISSKHISFYFKRGYVGYPKLSINAYNKVELLYLVLLTIHDLIE